MARTDKDQDILKAFEEDTDAFFDSLLAGESSAPPAKAEPKAAPKAAEGGFMPPARIEVPKAAPKAEAPTPEQQPAKAPPAVHKAEVPTVATSVQQPAKDPPAAPRAEAPNTLPEATAAEKMQAPMMPTSERQPQATPATPAAPRVEAYPQEDKLEELDTTGTSQSTQEKSERAAMFRMDSSGSEEAEVAHPDYDHSEDIVLHETLEDFYTQHRQTNMSNINAIVAKYRGHMVPHLWAQLSLKYNLAPLEGLELLSRSLYQSAPFEYREQERQTELEDTLAEVRKLVLAEGLAPSRTVLLERAMTRGAKDGNDGLLRLLAYRGLPDDQSLRAKVWKALLGYLPMKRHDEWNAIYGEKRALYASYRSELLTVSSSQEVSLNVASKSPGSEIDDQDLLQEIKNDVERTRRDFEYFRRPATKAALTALLFVYAKLNPGVRYVQGMNEIAAVLLYVMSAETDAETDAFWCFSEMMAEIKDGFMQALDHSGEGVYGMVEEISQMLRSYDPQLARHLARAELSLFVFVLRWCTVLFAQDATLPDVLRLWDSFIADPNRYGFVVHVCVAVILGKRDELLATDKQFELAEIMQAGPRGTDFEALLKKAFAICAFERRSLPPQFPPKRNQVIDDFSDWAQHAAAEAAAVASEVGADLSKNFQEKIAPAVMERAGQASEVVQDKAQALQSWIQETAPARQEAYEQAQVQLSSLWNTVRSRGQQFASEAATSETAATAAARLSSAAESASGLFARASMAFNAATPEAGPSAAPGSQKP